MKNIAQAAVVVALAWSAGAHPARTQDYPAAPVRIISGFSPGSTADITARVVGAKMGRILGQQFVIEDRTGAASSIAAALVARAEGRLYAVCGQRRQHDQRGDELQSELRHPQGLHPDHAA